jgi:hypothetical protein
MKDRHAPVDDSDLRYGMPFFGGHINITCFQLGIFSGGSVVSDGDNDLEVGGCQVWIR